MWRDIISVIFGHILYVIFPSKLATDLIKRDRASLAWPVNTLTRSKEGPGFLFAIRRLPISPAISPANSDASTGDPDSEYV